MKPVPFEGCNVILSSPGCYDVPALKDEGGFTTLWTFTNEERIAIAEGCDLVFSMASHGWPPVGMGVRAKDGTIVGDAIRKG